MTLTHPHESEYDDAEETNARRQGQAPARSPNDHTGVWEATPTPYGELIMYLLVLCLWLTLVLVSTIVV